MDGNLAALEETFQTQNHPQTYNEALNLAPSTFITLAIRNLSQEYFFRLSRILAN